MMKTLVLFVGIFFLRPVTAMTQKEFEAKYAAGFPKKNGATEEVWERGIGFIEKNQSPVLLKALLTHEPASGITTAWYRYDLLKVFKSQNQLVLEASEKLFSDRDCLLFWLIPDNGLVTRSEVESVLKKNGSALAQSYLDSIAKKIVKGEPKFERKDCRPRPVKL